MDKIDLANKRDFPFTTNVLNFMQTATEALEKLAVLGGDNYILSGCTVTGTSVSAGWVVLGGMVMPFMAGTVATNVSIRKAEAVVNVDGFTRTETAYYAEFGTTTEPGWQFVWADLYWKRSGQTMAILVDIGAWDMVANASIDVELDAVLGNISTSDIVSVSARIDRSPVYGDDNHLSGDLRDSGTIQWGIIEDSPVLIRLTRTAGGAYDSVPYESTDSSRGTLCITVKL